MSERPKSVQMEEWLAHPETRRELLEKSIAERRWQREVGGLTVNGVEFKTDEKSLLMLLGSVVLLPPNATVKWKSKGGFVTLNKTQLQEAVGHVMAHIQAGFTRESDLLNQLKELPDKDLDSFKEVVDKFVP